MENKIKEIILYRIEKLKEKKLLVEIEFPTEDKKFAVYSSQDNNLVHYKITYIPKNFIIKEDSYYMKLFPNFLSELDSQSDRINFLLKDLKEDALVKLNYIEYNSYFHFTEDKVIINLDTFNKNLDVFKDLLNIYDSNPIAFIRKIVDFDMYDKFNELTKNGKMKYFKSTIFNVKIQKKKYIVFNTANSFEKIFYIIDDNNKYMDITDDNYLKILKKLSLINSL